MIWLPKKKILLPKYQRGILQMAAGGIAAAAGGGGFTYRLEDFAIHSTCPEGDACDADAIFQTDGVILERRDLALGGTSATTSEASPWSNDPSEDGTGHHVRLVSHDSGTDRFNPGALVLGTWYALSTLRQFEFQDGDTSGPYDGTSTYTFGLSDDGGSSTIDTCTATIRLQNEGP